VAAGSLVAGGIAWIEITVLILQKIAYVGSE